MKWTQNEIELLSPVLERFRIDLKSLDGKNVLVLCSVGSDVAIWLAKRMKQGKVAGLELDQRLFVHACRLAEEQGLVRRLVWIICAKALKMTFAIG